MRPHAVSGVMILTSSGAEQDIAQAYDLHANCYVIKPDSYSKFQQVIKSLEDFWFTNVSLPPTPEPAALPKSNDWVAQNLREPPLSGSFPGILQQFASLPS